mgnify:CR=1 FL=1
MNILTPNILLAMKDNLLKSITPYKAPEVVKTIMQTCSMIDDYIANPSEELYANIMIMFTVLDEIL